MIATPDVRLNNLVKRFGEVTAVDNLSLDIPRNSFVTLLGPSGCGKTTTLRMIGGFEFPDSGEVLIQGKPMGNTPPYVRDTSMVFQSYALFPHMSVHENIAFGLRERKLGKQEIQERVRGMLQLIDLPDIADRKPQHLSGGQQQRVALARSLVVEPTVLLLDEPLGALDSLLRRQMQIELKRIQQQLGITFVYVTHDQDEALTISDRIVIMRDGKVEQAGTPEEIFESPVSGYVAEFMGATNLIPVSLESQDANVTIVSLAGQRLVIPKPFHQMGESVDLVIRPEQIRLGAQHGWQAEIVASTYHGSSVRYQVRLGDGTLLVAASRSEEDKVRKVGDEVHLDIQGDDVALVPSTRDPRTMQ